MYVHKNLKRTIFSQNYIFWVVFYTFFYKNNKNTILEKSHTHILFILKNKIDYYKTFIDSYLKNYLHIICR